AGADALYVLGDLFEYWIGDEDLETPFNALIAGFLQRLADSGTRVRVMHGNRDFLLGEAFCEASGAQLLADPTVIDGTLLIHGHTHRPGKHALELDGRRCERWVLPDWYGRGGYLELAGSRARLIRW